MTEYQRLRRLGDNLLIVAEFRHALAQQIEEDVVSLLKIRQLEADAAATRAAEGERERRLRAIVEVVKVLA